ncbi:hypothetical protein FRB95_002834 [Tulasnella sp. JGI-2019a]|nr:hypothetical protein FRB95_002834 [Tulasnella sp. JGI-2019a]
MADASAKSVDIAVAKNSTRLRPSDNYLYLLYLRSGTSRPRKPALTAPIDAVTAGHFVFRLGPLLLPVQWNL